MDYDALARQFGGTTTPQSQDGPWSAFDAALRAQSSGSVSQPPQGSSFDASPFQEILTILTLIGLLIGIVSLFVASYRRFKAWKEAKRPANQIQALEGKARFWKEQALADPSHLGKEMEAFLLGATGEDYLRLKERFRHDLQKRLQLAQDWAAYAEAINALSSASNHLDADLEKDAVDKYGERVTVPHITRQEIEARFQKMLGQTPIDRWEQAKHSKH